MRAQSCGSIDEPQAGHAQREPHRSTARSQLPKDSDGEKKNLTAPGRKKRIRARTQGIAAGTPRTSHRNRCSTSLSGRGHWSRRGEGPPCGRGESLFRAAEPALGPRRRVESGGKSGGPAPMSPRSQAWLCSLPALPRRRPRPPCWATRRAC